MAENKMGPNIQAGAGFLAKRVQKSLNRAQEKVLQKLGKTMETKDEQFEQCSQNLSKQQADGVRLTKDVRAYFTAVKAIHESSKRLSQTLRDVYESEWSGGEDLSDIIEKEDLMWNDYEEKMSDQIVRTMENYTGQFPEVKERVAKRGRKLVDYDSARHHLEALQGAKKKDDGKLAKAEDEFNKAQNVFEELNKELREELPVLYQSRIGCYVTVFQNISNLRDVFYKEMSLLNHELYNVMKKLETQHSGKAFIIKGLNSSKSKKRKSIVISNPIPCNTAFPTDHVSVHPTGRPSAPDTLTHAPGPSREPRPSDDAVGPASKDPASSSSSASDMEDLGSDGSVTPKRQSACDSESGERSAERRSPDRVEAEADLPELCSSQSDDSGVGVPTPEVAGQEAAHPLPPVSATPRQLEQKDEAGLTPLPEVKAKAPPIPTPRSSFGAADRQADSRGKVEAEKQEVEAEKEVVEAEKQEVEAEKQEVEAEKEVVEAEKQEVEAEKQEVEAEKEVVEAEKQEVEAEKEVVEAEKQEVEAEKQEVEAEKQEVEAEKQEVEAEKQEVEAEKEVVEAEKEVVEAEKQEVEAEKQEVEAEKEVVEAEKEVVEAEKEVVEAEKEVVEAEKEVVEAEKEVVEAEKEVVEAEKEVVEAEKEGVEAETEASGKDSTHSPSDSLCKGGAVASQASSEAGEQAS